MNELYNTQTLVPAEPNVSSSPYSTSPLPPQPSYLPQHCHCASLITLKSLFCRLAFRLALFDPATIALFPFLFAVLVFGADTMLLQPSSVVHVPTTQQIASNHWDENMRRLR